ncbi:MAG: hypothetical protein HRT98_04330 [Mycoplasmatales bacterium]|nr:hypothetical protein [Mycoplasmatales bacterium]
MKQSKKIILTMGAIATIAIPTTLVVTATQNIDKTINTNYLQKGINSFSETSQTKSIIKQESFDFDNSRPLLSGNNMDTNRVGIFEDSQGNLWSWGHRLQVLRKGAAKWEYAWKTGHTSTGGIEGTMFEDRDGNLWTMGFNSELQVLKKGQKFWEDAGHGNKFYGGLSGTMFQDREGNIWAMAEKKPLQVLRVGKTEWEDAGHGSDMKSGGEGKMLQDKDGNLWAIAGGAELQVLRHGQTEWEKAKKHGNKIKGGEGTTLYEDNDGNIWTMGRVIGSPQGIWSTERCAPLQVLRRGQTEWEESSLNKKIKNTVYGNMLQDREGNLWVMAEGISLQVLRAGKTEWEDAGHGNNIKRKRWLYSYIFQDNEGNIWTATTTSSLQVLRRGQTEWEDMGRKHNFKGISRGKMFEDSHGNLWVTSASSKPQVLKKGRTEWVDASIENSKYVEPANREQKLVKNDLMRKVHTLAENAKTSWVTAGDIENKVESNSNNFKEIFGMDVDELISPQFKNTRIRKYQITANENHVMLTLTLSTFDASNPTKVVTLDIGVHTDAEVKQHNLLKNKNPEVKKPKIEQPKFEQPKDKQHKTKPEVSKKPDNHISTKVSKKPSKKESSNHKYKFEWNLWTIVGVSAGGAVGLIMFISLLVYLIKRKK